jgi:hypothetical protein
MDTYLMYQQQLISGSRQHEENCIAHAAFGIDHNSCADSYTMSLWQLSALGARSTSGLDLDTFPFSR